MPTYQYRCTECDTELEVVQRFSDPSLTECPSCGAALRKVFNAVGVVFKGSGFYRTDSRAEKSKSAKSGESSANGAASESPKSESAAKSEAATKSESAKKSDSAPKTGGAGESKSPTKKVKADATTAS